MSSSRGDYLCGVGTHGHSRMSILNEANKEHVNLLLDKLDLKNDMLALDIACGTGEITCQMAERSPGAHVVGIDFSEEQIKIAREYAATKKLNNVTFIVMSAYEVKTLTERFQFDRIFIRWVLGHLEFPQRVIDSCKELLKPHGIIVCEEGNIRTHHCESHNPFFQARYGFFVEKIHALQEKNGIDAAIGEKLAAMFGAIFAEIATIETEQHQLTLTDSAQKEAVTTSFLDETGQKFTDESILTPQQLCELQSDLDIMSHDDKTKIFYTADTSVVVKLQ